MRTKDVPLNFHVPSLEDKLSRNCPYLDTIDRSVLDFDFEKLCSVSLLNNNVYACLVCGKYFQGMASLPVTNIRTPKCLISFPSSS